MNFLAILLMFIGCSIIYYYTPIVLYFISIMCLLFGILLYDYDK